MFLLHSVSDLSCLPPGELSDRGIVIPTTRGIYLPILEGLKTEGIEATFRTSMSQ